METKSTSYQPLLNNRDGFVVGSADKDTSIAASNQSDFHFVSRLNGNSIDENGQHKMILQGDSANQSNVEETAIAVVENGPIEKSGGRKRCLRILKYAGVFFIVVTGLLVGFIYHMGWFDHIETGIELDGHGNAIEPNTGIKFPLVLEFNTHQPSGGTKKMKQHLIGMFLKVNTLATLNMKIVVMGYYVQWDIAKKVLLPWKNKKQDLHHPDPELIKIVTDGKTLPGTIKYIMTMTVPGMSLRDGWAKQLHQIYVDEHVDSQNMKKFDDSFHQWMTRSVHNHDHYELSWGFSPVMKGLEEDEFDEEDMKLDDNDLSSTISFVYNSKPIPPLEQSHEMIHAIMRNQVEQNYGNLFNLLPLLWEH